MKTINMSSLRKKLMAFALVAAMVFSIGAVPSDAASKSSAPKIKKVEYEGGGVVDVDFAGKVKYGKYQVTVKDLKGKSYAVRILERDSDDLTFRIVNYKKNHTYKFSISKIRKANSNRYHTVSGKIGIELNKNSGNISLDRAKQIATGNVGLKPNQVKFKTAKLDREDGKQVYEIEFIYKYCEYEYEILASSGKILSRDIDRID